MTQPCTQTKTFTEVIMTRQRHLRKSIEKALTMIAIFLGILIVSVDDFDFNGFLVYLGMIALEVSIGMVLTLYGREQ